MLRPHWNENERCPLERQYEVVIGHSTVRVRSASEPEAIEQARRLLCVEMPRMWDVIQSMDASRFHVRSIRELPREAS